MPEFLRNNCVTMKEFEKIIILHVGPFGSWGNIFQRGGGLSLSRLFRPTHSMILTVINPSLGVGIFLVNIWDGMAWYGMG
mgnify:FL=1